MAILLAITPQDRVNAGRPSGGRASGGEDRVAASMVAARMGLDCQIVQADRLGSDASGIVHYEVFCDSGRGYVLIDNPPPARPTAISCLAFTVGGEGRQLRERRCRLPANRIDGDTWRDLAAEAGVDCPVDQGVMLGMTSARSEVFEIGCRGEAGYRIERSDDGRWTATDCITLFARGERCDFTTGEEAVATFERWIAPASLSGCRVSQVRFMGAEGADRYFEATCGASENQVVRLGADNRLIEVIPCADASSIGAGCIGVAATRPPPDPDTGS